MRRAIRILGYIALALVGLLIVGYGSVFALSESKVRRKHTIAPGSVDIPSDSAAVKEGQRLAQIRGCTGCHGAMAQGNTFIDNWVLARVVAPNLTRAVRQYSTAEFVGIVRQGVRPDGRSLLGMPSSMFFALTDQDLGAIIAYLRSLPEATGPSRDVRLGPLARFGLAIGQFLTSATEVDSMAKLTSVYPSPPDPHARGAYLARTVCSECHGLDLRGEKSGIPPDLRIAGAYPLDAFVTLMRTGKPLDGRDLGLMREVAVRRFVHFTDDEIRSLHEFLAARARLQTPSQP